MRQGHWTKPTPLSLGERRTLGLRKWRGRRVHGAMGASRRHSRAPTRESMPLISGCDTRPSRQRLYPPTMLLEPVLSRSKGIPETPGAGAPARRSDLRVNVAKCRRMSHFSYLHSENVAFTSKKPHVFGQNPAILADSRSFRSSSASSPMWGRIEEGGTLFRDSLARQAAHPRRRQVHSRHQQEVPDEEQCDGGVVGSGSTQAGTPCRGRLPQRVPRRGSYG